MGPAALGLLHLAAQGPLRPSAAAGELTVPAQSITRAVADLTAAGLARRVEDAADGRSYVIELTDAGLAARAEFAEQLSARFSRHLAGWSTEEIDDFAAHLQRLVSSLAQDVSAPTAEPTRNPWRAER